jgi:hypothetical protein
VQQLVAPLTPAALFTISGRGECVSSLLPPGTQVWTLGGAPPLDQFAEVIDTPLGDVRIVEHALAFGCDLVTRGYYLRDRQLDADVSPTQLTPSLAALIPTVRARAIAGTYSDSTCSVPVATWFPECSPREWGRTPPPVLASSGETNGCVAMPFFTLGPKLEASTIYSGTSPATCYALGQPFATYAVSAEEPASAFAAIAEQHE